MGSWGTGNMWVLGIVGPWFMEYRECVGPINGGIMRYWEYVGSGNSGSWSHGMLGEI